MMGTAICLTEPIYSPYDTKNDRDSRSGLEKMEKLSHGRRDMAFMRQFLIFIKFVSGKLYHRANEWMPVRKWS